MEEAWKLAVVSVGEKPSPQTFDWSSRHVRLKYQMFISAVLFYCATHFKMSEISLFSIVKFEIPPDSSLVKLALFVFTCFSVLAFVSRTRNETVKAEKVEYGYLRNSSKLIEGSQTLKTSLDKSFWTNSSALMNVLRSRNENSDMVQISTLSGLYFTKFGADIEAAKKFFAKEISPLLKLIEERQTKLQKPDFYLDFGISSFQSIGKHFDNIVGILSDLENGLEEEFNLYRLETNLYILKNDMKFADSFFRSGTDGYKGSNLWYKLERNVLSIWGPVAASIAIIGNSLMHIASK